MIGSTVAKLWIDAGHEVRLSSRHPADLQRLVKRLGNCELGLCRPCGRFCVATLCAIARRQDRPGPARRP